MRKVIIEDTLCDIFLIACRDVDNFQYSGSLLSREIVFKQQAKLGL